MNGHRSPMSTNLGVACSRPQANTSTDYKQDARADAFKTDRDHKPSHDRLVLKAAITLGFFVLLWICEFIVLNRHGFNTVHMYMYPCSSNPGANMERPYLHKGFPWLLHVLDNYCTVANFSQSIV